MAKRRTTTTTRDDAALVRRLTDPRCYDHPVRSVSLAETHISWVFLTGRFAYKVKKPVKLPFLDFSTLEQRRKYCEQEIVVNRRLAPKLYLGVVPIGGTPEAPRVGRKPAFEYAVKMRQFDTAARLDHCIEADEVPLSAVLAFAEELAQFHARSPANAPDPTGRAACAAALDNFDSLAEYTRDRERDVVQSLRNWTERQCARLSKQFAARAIGGAHRDCHGDLHLENLLMQRGKIVAYDALEFDPLLREIDAVNEAAFLGMDLLAHRRRDLAFGFLNRYFEVAGDYDGIEVLRFYLVYRALVRAKVRAIKAAQGHHEKGGDPLEPYLGTAFGLTATRRPLLLITHGLSGSGKTTITDELVTRLPALRARSDLERKRLHGLAATERSGSGVGSGLYTVDATKRTYVRLGDIADRLLRNGFDAIIDATFLRRAEREYFWQVAAANAARYAVLDCTAPEDELRRRIVTRAAAARDASEASLAVLDRQLAMRDPLTAAENRHTIHVDTTRPIDCAAIERRLSRL